MGVVAGRHEKRDGASGADADDLDREIAQAKAVEQDADMLGQRVAVACEAFRIMCFHAWQG